MQAWSEIKSKTSKMMQRLLAGYFDIRMQNLYGKFYMREVFDYCKREQNNAQGGMQCKAILNKLKAVGIDVVSAERHFDVSILSHLVLHGFRSDFDVLYSGDNLKTYRELVRQIGLARNTIMHDLAIEEDHLTIMSKITAAILASEALLVFLECSDEWQENGKDNYIIRLRKEINDIRGMILLGHSTFEHNPVENSLEYNQLVDVSSDEATHGFVIENSVLLEYTGDSAVVTIPQGTTSIADCVFMQNHTVEVVNLPEGLAIIGDAAFCDCPNLRRINFPESLVHIGNDAFFACAKLEKLLLPKNLLQIGSNAFGNCEKIPEVHIPARLLELHSDSFHGCISLKKIAVDSKSEMFCVYDDCLYDILQEKLLIASGAKEIFAFPKSIKSIGRALSGNVSITQIEIPGSVIAIEDEAFSKCVSLQSIILNEGISSIGRLAFNKCVLLKEVVLPKTLSQSDIHPLAFNECPIVNLKNSNESSIDCLEQTDCLLGMYVGLINAITLQEWGDIQEEIKDKEYSQCFFSGIFCIYKMAISRAFMEQRSYWVDLLSYYESIYVAASKRGLTEVCAFLSGISNADIVEAATDIKSYMIKNIDCFGKSATGLDKICFNMLTLAGSDSTINRLYWEMVLKETFEIYRMIRNKGKY